MKDRRWLRYLITFGVCLAVALGVFFARAGLDGTSPVPPAQIAMAVCDGFFVPGAFCFLFGLLMWIASEGALDGVAYLASYLGKTLIPGKRSSIERYDAFLQRRREKKRGPVGHLLVVGLVFLLLSVAALMVFHRL